MPDRCLSSTVTDSSSALPRWPAAHGCISTHLVLPPEPVSPMCSSQAPFRREFRHLLRPPLCVSPFNGPPCESFGAHADNMSCPAPLTVQVSIEPKSYSSFLRTACCVSRRPLDPLDPVFVWLPPWSCNSAEHPVLGRFEQILFGLSDQP